ncbi:hypothetical protein D039_4504A, partial [Vibrio parahaemolyticus EKP-028]|jgi:hypothetical protein
MRM